MEKLWQSFPSSNGLFLAAHELDHLKETSRREGVQETELRLGEKHSQELAALRGEIALALSGFEREQDRFFRSMEKQVVELALEISRRAIGREMNHDPTLLSQTVKKILFRIQHGGVSTVRVSASDLPAWQEALKSTSCQIAGDAELPPGRCIVETPLGSAIVDPFSELDEIEAAFARVSEVNSQDSEAGTVQ
jgi:flagellar biosynthesis/type III secretory pathway protein FliH